MLRSLLQGFNYSNWSLYLCMNAPLGEPGGRTLQSVQTAMVSLEVIVQVQSKYKLNLMEGELPPIDLTPPTHLMDSWKESAKSILYGKTRTSICHPAKRVYTTQIYKLKATKDQNYETDGFTYCMPASSNFSAYTRRILPAQPALADADSRVNISLSL